MTMRNSLLKLAALASTVVALTALVSSCGDFNEGINAKDIRGTVVIPKALASTNVGMVYVGVWAGLDTRLGYPSPEAAPQSSSAGADTFPYGGSSVGTFFTRDARFICEVIGAREAPRDAGANWEVDFEILQFPFYEGATVWAFVDQVDGGGKYGTCNAGGGYSDYYQILVDLLEVTPDANGTDFEVVINSTVLNGGDGSKNFVAEANQDKVELIDEAGRFWEVIDVDDATDTLTLQAPVGGGGTPFANGDQMARLYIRDDEAPITDYGTQFNDILNFPSKYIAAGDLVASESGAVVLNSLSPVRITIDTTVVP